MSSNEEHLEQNRRRWDELVPIHVGSRFYDVDAFRAGRCALLPIEREELGDVRGRSLCHLQCHFGLDTLSWARRGADVTGVDFSTVGLAAARGLAEEVGLQARFIESEVTRAPEALGGETFDIVFTSWGVLGWLPDLEAWARAVAALIKPGGTFYLIETHPVILLYDTEDEKSSQRHYPYFRRDAPLLEEESGSYADASAAVRHRRHYAWIFEIGQVVNALIDAGLELEYLHEHDGTCNPVVPQMTKSVDGLWRLPPTELSMPLSFSIRARKRS